MLQPWRVLVGLETDVTGILRDEKNCVWYSSGNAAVFNFCGAQVKLLSTFFVFKYSNLCASLNYCSSPDQSISFG